MDYAPVTFLTVVFLCTANGDPSILGDHHWVFLEELAKQYIKKMNATHKGHVSTWGLTEKYSYWNYNDPPGKHPVKAKIAWTSYSECKGASSLKTRERDCTGFFHWRISRGIKSAFSVKVEELVPVLYSGLRRKLLKFDINDVTEESADERWGRTTRHVRRKLVKACKFKAEINFDGYFVYTLSNPDEGNFRWILVSISQLADSSKGLEEKGDKLSYVAKGIYVERILCYGHKK